MPTLTSLVTLPVRLTLGTVSLVARTGYSLATALLREHSGAPTNADGAAAAEPESFDWEASDPGGGTPFAAAEEAIDILKAEDDTLAAPGLDAQAEDETLAAPGLDAQAEDDTAAAPDVGTEDDTPARDATSAPAPPVDEPVSEEPVVVAEVAEPGAEEGAGAEVSVDEPLSGYHTMKAADVIDWLQTATAAEVAVTELYERAHRGRKSIFAAADRRLKQIQNSPRRS